MTAAPAIALEGIGRRFGALTALNGVSLTVPEGQIWGLLGHNGAGKTTMMKLVLGLLRPSTGTVRVLGLTPTGPEAGALRRRIGYLPEAVAFYDDLSGREALRYFARLKGRPAREADGLLERVELAAAADRRIKTYSKGMRQRLGLAQALLGDPRLLLLDEPTVGLDPIATGRFYQLLRDLRDQGVTTLLSSHVLPGIERHVDRVAILGGGRLLASGTMEELRAATPLPVYIRLCGTWPPGQWQDLVSDPRISVRRHAAGDLEILVPAGGKLDLLRQLMAAEGVADISLTPPGLEALYAHFCHPDSPRRETP